MARLTGSITVPAGCVHITLAAMPYDGYFAVTTTQPGFSGAVNSNFIIGSPLPGPGFPASTATQTITLYRAVDATELAAISAAGGKYTLGPAQEGKYFFVTRAEAELLATRYEGMGLGNYTVTSGTVKQSVLASTAESIVLAGEGTGYFMTIGGVNQVSKVTIIG